MQRVKSRLTKYKLDNLNHCSYFVLCLYLPAPPAPQPAGIMNNGAKDVTKDIQKLQQQLQDIKDQVGSHLEKTGEITLVVDISILFVPNLLKLKFNNYLQNKNKMKPKLFFMNYLSVK